MNYKKAKNYDDAWNIQDTHKDKPHGWIQWKGTNVCMDVRCKCGNLSHVDSSFAYNVKCGYCGTVYMTNGYIELIELEEQPEHCVVLTEVDDGVESYSEPPKIEVKFTCKKDDNDTSI